MKQKLFLTSCIAMGFVAPAFAETFPSDGYMAENKTYENAATAENMDSVYEGTVNAVAEYTDIFYNIVAGNYLAAGSDDENGTICPAGSYCSGLTHAPYNETSNQGIQSCPTGYALSVAGASSENECYRTCTTSDVAHSTDVTGGYYYGDNNQCEPTGCVNGWHVKAGVNGSAIATAIGDTESNILAYINNDGSFTENSGATHGATYYGLTNKNMWAVDYGDKGMLVGQGRCSTQSGNGSPWTNPTITSNLTDETGEDGATNCYCNVTGYTPAGGTLQSLNSLWVYHSNIGSAYVCANVCASGCATLMHDTYQHLAFRAALLGTVQSSPAMCEANTITINWSNADADDVAANNAGTATYGSDVRTPVKAETIKGKTFKGWKFSKPTTTQLP